MMKKTLVLLLVLTLGSILPLPALEYSPTQVTLPAGNGRSVSLPSTSLMDRILADDHLALGAETISFSADGSQVRSLRGDLSESLEGDVETAVAAWLRENASLFHLPPDQRNCGLQQVRHDIVDGWDHLGYRMVLEGIPVFEARIDVHLGRDRRVHLVTGAFPAIERVSNRWLLPADAAVERALGLVGAVRLRGSSSVEPVIFPENGSGKAAFLVRFPAEQPLGDYDIVVDAETGDELYRMNQMPFLDGRGSVYVVDPLKSSVSVETLPNLTGNQPAGLFVNVVNEDGASAVSSSREFIYDPADTHFDEINVYYHINHIHDFFRNFGHMKMDRPIKTIVHYGTALDRAFYSPQNDTICLGDGSKLNDLSKDATVIYHEYSHASLRSILSLTYSGESGAINEGQADYFACTLTGDPKVGQWAAAKKPGDYLRKIENILHYPEAMVYEVHADGRIWGGVCWDLRKALGPSIADRLIQRSLYFLKPIDATFFDGYQSILAADRVLNGSANAGRITEIFTRRGIATAGSRGLVLERENLRRMRAFLDLHAPSAVR